ncbi:MAG: helix-turn-helix domain-containing protein [Pseudomonadota bacterium]|nr:helix-turn-helix domain-containing protein [Pseudomonadota bacterium]
MRLRYHLPRADLRDFVRAYYLFETDERTVQPIAAEIGNVRCLLSGGGCFHMPDGSREPFSPLTLLGPTMGAYLMEAEPGTRAFGVGILPRGWGILLGVAAEELADRIIDFMTIAGAPARATAEEIRNASTLPQMAAAADRFFARELGRRARRRAYPWALERWLTDSDDLGLDALTDMMDMSRRQIDRISKQFFGASPKILQRKYRVLRAADRIQFDHAANWLDAAGPAFYDQSHFIKEFKTFIGATPGEYARNQAALTAAIRSGRRDLGRSPLSRL